jgi:hypothetical protein
MASRFSHAPIEPARWSRNGKYPDAVMRLATTMLANSTAQVRVKEIARFSSNMNTLTAGLASGETVLWRFAYMPSPYTVAIHARAMMISTNTFASSDPYAVVTIDGLGDCEVHYGDGLSAQSSLYFTNQSTDIIDAAPTDNTWHFGQVSVFNYARVVAMSIYEYALDQADPFPQGYAASTPILDTDRELVTIGARNMWKQQGAKLFTWSTDHEGAPRTRTSATAINVINNSSTTVSAATPGFLLDLRYRSTVRRTTVPVTLWVYGSSAGATGGTVTLKDSGGVAVATVSGIGAGGGGADWYSTTANLPATEAKYDLHMSSPDGVNTLTLYAATLAQYEA